MAVMNAMDTTGDTKIEWEGHGIGMDAQKATKIARQYLKPFASFQPTSGKKEDDYWVIRVDIGLFEKKVVELEIDNQGEILRAR